MGATIEFKEVSIRLARAGEEGGLQSIRRRAWEAAYGHIYSLAEIERYFAGDSEERRTWPALACKRVETLVAEVEGKVAAYARWGCTAGAEGELHSLYVLPGWWDGGMGSRLWERVMAGGIEGGVLSLDIWVLQRARSGEFYQRRGCKKVGHGDYFIGGHRETALCYRKLLE